MEEDVMNIWESEGRDEPQEERASVPQSPQSWIRGSHLCPLHCVYTERKEESPCPGLLVTVWKAAWALLSCLSTRGLARADSFCLA